MDIWTCRKADNLKKKEDVDIRLIESRMARHTESSPQIQAMQ